MEAFQRVQTMIQEARLWLDKAEDSYKSANPIRGELDLHLAQAEIQRACETSRAICLGPQRKESTAKREQKPDWVRYYTVGAAAAVIGMMFIASLSFVSDSTGSRLRNHSLLGASFNIEPIYVYLDTSRDSNDANENRSIGSEGNSQRHSSFTIAASNDHNQKGLQSSKRNRRNGYVPVSTDSGNSPDVSRFYEVPDSREHQWHAATTHWGEDRIIRYSVPSFSRNISTEGGR